MHELAIVHGIMRSVDEQKQKHAFERVLKIHVACGRYNCLSEDSLNFYFETLAAGTCMAGAVIEVRRYEHAFQCRPCGRRFFSQTDTPSPCPQCGSCEAAAVLNHELYLNNLEVE